MVMIVSVLGFKVQWLLHEKTVRGVSVVVAVVMLLVVKRGLDVLLIWTSVHLKRVREPCFDSIFFYFKWVCEPVF